MLLQRLNEFADRLDIPPTMYKKTRVPWLIPLDLSGNLAGQVEATSGGTGGGRGADRGKEFVVPHVGARTSGIKPILLVDTAAYVLGLRAEKDGEDKGARTAGKHGAFMALVRECLEDTAAPEVRAVLSFLEAYDRSPRPSGAGIDARDTVGFVVDGRFPTDLPTVKDFWARHAGDVPDADPMTCLVCGRTRPPVSRFPVPIRKMIPGGQLSGTQLVSINIEAFESFGLKTATVSPVCHECAERAGLALNHLLGEETTHYLIGGDSSVVYVFWTRDDVPFRVRTFLRDPQPDEVKKLIASAGTARQAQGIDATAFYATSLSGSGGRVVVRDWLETTVGEVKRNLARYFTLQRIVGRGGESRPLPIWMLQGALQPPRKGRGGRRTPAPAGAEAALLRCALEGAPLPLWLMFKALTRNHADRKVTTGRAALIKLVMLSNRNRDVEEEEMVTLDPGNCDPGYVCGRVLAVLESAQRLALPGIKATIVDRFFGTASCAPNSVFPRLIRGAQPHLAKLRKDDRRRGLHVYLQRQLEQVLALLPAFPKVLTLSEQGAFALGYYHQRAFRPASAPGGAVVDEDTGTEEEEAEA